MDPLHFSYQTNKTPEHDVNLGLCGVIKEILLGELDPIKKRH